MQRLYNIIELSRDLLAPSDPEFSEDNLPAIAGRVYLVTGASAGIGFETARLLVKAGAKVWLLGRTLEKIERAIARIKRETPNAKLEGIQVCYEDLSSIKPALEPLLAKETRLDGIVHNAGINFSGRYELMSEGYDKILVVNCLAPHLVQKLLDPLLIKTAKSSPRNSVRIVWAASSSHYFSPPAGGIDWHEINKPDNGLLGFGVYGQTKAIVIYQAALWPKYHEGSGVVSVSIHPGIVTSDIRRERPDRNRAMALLCRPTVTGGYTEVIPLLSPSITVKDNGTYYLPFLKKGHVRPDVAQAIEGPRGTKTWEWLEDTVKPFS